MLIAFTVAVAGIFGVWLPNFTRTQTETVRQQSETELTCTYGGISLSSLKFNSTTGRMLGNVENTRIISLGGITLQIFYSNTSTEKFPLCTFGATVTNCTTSNTSLAPREAVSFNVSANSNYDTVRVFTNCSSVYDSATSGDVTSVS